MKSFEYGPWLRLSPVISDGIYVSGGKREVWMPGTLMDLPGKYDGWHFEFYLNGNKKAMGFVPSGRGRSTLWDALNN